MEVGFGDAVVAAEVAFGLVPDVLDAVDMVATIGDEGFGMVDPHVVELGDVKDVARAETVGVDNAIGLDPMANDADQGWRPGIGDDHRVNPSTPLEKAKDRHLARRSSAPLAFADATETALIDRDFTGRKRRVLGQFGGDDLAQLVETEDRGVAVDPHQFGRRARRNAPATNWTIKAR